MLGYLTLTALLEYMKMVITYQSVAVENLGGYCDIHIAIP